MRLPPVFHTLEEYVHFLDKYISIEQEHMVARFIPLNFLDYQLYVRFIEEPDLLVTFIDMLKQRKLYILPLALSGVLIPNQSPVSITTKKYRALSLLRNYITHFEDVEPILNNDDYVIVYKPEFGEINIVDVLVNHLIKGEYHRLGRMIIDQSTATSKKYHIHRSFSFIRNALELISSDVDESTLSFLAGITLGDGTLTKFHGLLEVFVESRDAPVVLELARRCLSLAQKRDGAWYYIKAECSHFLHPIFNILYMYRNPTDYLVGLIVADGTVIVKPKRLIYAKVVQGIRLRDDESDEIRLKLLEDTVTVISKLTNISLNIEEHSEEAMRYMLRVSKPKTLEIFSQVCYKYNFPKFNNICEYVYNKLYG